MSRYNATRIFADDYQTGYMAAERPEKSFDDEEDFDSGEDWQNLSREEKRKRKKERQLERREQRRNKERERDTW